MSWDDAKIYCKKLGAGWRLPTKDELNMLYENKEEIGGFAVNGYWSSTEFDIINAWYFTFYYENAYYNNKNNPIYVRAVRAS